MNKLLVLFAALCLLGACNFTKNQSEKPRVQLMTHKEAADTMRIASIDSASVDSLTQLIEYGYLSPERTRDIMGQLNLHDLISSGRLDEATIFNGFYGTDFYRIEFYISNAELDPADSLRILLEGKCRYKKNITNFTGSIKVDSMFAYRDLTYDYQDFLEYEGGDTSAKFEGDTFVGTYHLKGTFALNEDPNQPASGVFSGNFFMDFVPNYNDHAQLDGYRLWYNTNNETKRGGFLFDGSWLSNKGGKTKPVIFAADLFMFANEIISDFSYGEREVEINEKYRSLGWENYWEADEWWTDNKDSKALIIYMPR